MPSKAELQHSLDVNVTINGQLTIENKQLRTRLHNSLYLVFNAKDVIEPLIGEQLMGPVPTTDFQGVIFSGEFVKVTVIPSREQVIIDGIGTNIRRCFQAENGALAGNQVELILATVERIQRWHRDGVDPFIEKLDLAGTPVESTDQVS